MFCPKCGSQIPVDNYYCSICGASAARSGGLPSSSGGLPALSGYRGEISGANVPDYLVWNILATLFCCPPLGIVGLIYSSKVNGAKARGDDAAEAASAAARTCLNVCVAAGLASGFALVVYFFVATGLYRQ